MAKYSRAEIDALSQRLEARAASMMFPDQPNLKADIRAAALLLRLMVTLADVQTIDTSPPLCGLNDGPRPS
jgi:hypothetical protein